MSASARDRQPGDGRASSACHAGLETASARLPAPAGARSRVILEPEATPVPPARAPLPGHACEQPLRLGALAAGLNAMADALRPPQWLLPRRAPGLRRTRLRADTPRRSEHGARAVAGLRSDRLRPAAGRDRPRPRRDARVHAATTSAEIAEPRALPLAVRRVPTRSTGRDRMRIRTRGRGQARPSDAFLRLASWSNLARLPDHRRWIGRRAPAAVRRWRRSTPRSAHADPPCAAPCTGCCNAACNSSCPWVPQSVEPAVPSPSFMQHLASAHQLGSRRERTRPAVVALGPTARRRRCGRRIRAGHPVRAHRRRCGRRHSTIRIIRRRRRAPQASRVNA